jgi:hypothetical protein
LIKTAAGTGLGSGGPLTKRSGWAGIGAGEHIGPDFEQLARPAVVDIGRGEQRDPAVAVLAVVPGEEPLAEGPGILERAEPIGKARPVLERLEAGLGVRIVVALTWGRLWLLTIPRSASRSATGREVIELPRSAWMSSESGSMPCLATESAMSRCASAALSLVATIHPGT